MAFRNEFWWGTASSSTQCEGSAPASDWRTLEEAGLVPRTGEGNGFATRYDEDFGLFAEYGLTHHRLSIEWARIEPEPGRPDDAAVEHYRSVLTAAHDAGVHPWVCLHHFTLPGWFRDEGGFLDERARSYFWPRHVAFCAETFGDLVYGWKPINEPAAYVTFVLRHIEPDRCGQPHQWPGAIASMLLAQRDAWRELRGADSPVATIHSLSPLFVVDDALPANQMKDGTELLLWNMWMRADRDGVLAVPGKAEREVPDLREACDIVGFSYYSALGFDARGSVVPYPTEARVGPLGYAPWPEGLGLVLRRLADELPNRPLLVCEHGVGTEADRPQDDEWRCEVLTESLGVLDEALDDGIDVRGFFHWTGVDNYEWLHGYDVAFGCFDRDRNPKGSADLLRSRASVAR